MSVRVMTWVWDQTEVGGGDRLLLLALADEADDEGGSCYPSIRRLAAKTRTHTNTVQRGVGRLEAAGLIEVDRPEKQGRGHFNRYRLLVERAPNQCPSDQGKARDDPEKSARQARADPVLRTDPRVSARRTTQEIRTAASTAAHRRAELVAARNGWDSPKRTEGLARALLRDHGETLRALAADGATDAEMDRRLSVDDGDQAEVPRMSDTSATPLGASGAVLPVEEVMADVPPEGAAPPPDWRRGL